MLLSSAALGAGRCYVSIEAEPIDEEGIDDAGACQPSFYILGAMKAATTSMAITLQHAGIPVHPHEHHFWEHYPAFEWFRGGDALNVTRLFNRQAEVSAAQFCGAQFLGAQFLGALLADAPPPPLLFYRASRRR